MKNLQNKKQKNDVHIHIENGFDIINTYLPTDYLEKVLLKFPKRNDITKDMISNVRRKRQNPTNSLDIFKAILEVAVENRDAIQSIAGLTK